MIGQFLIAFYAAWELESSGGSSRKNKRSHAQTGRCFRGKSLPSYEGVFALVVSQQEPQL